MIWNKYKVSLLVIILFSVFFSLLFSYCTTRKKSYKTFSGRNVNLAKEDLINAQFYFYRNSDTSVTLYTAFNTTSLLFARLDTGLQFYASVKVKVYLYSTTKNLLTDSSSDVFYIPQNVNAFFNFISVPAKNDDYSAKIYITDLNKKVQYAYYTELKVSNDNTRQNFLVTLNDSLLFKPYIIAGGKIKIYHRKKFTSLNVDVLKYRRTPALPPFSNIPSSFNYLPDSSFTLYDNGNGYYMLQLNSNAYYHIRISTNELDGLSIFSIDSVFPNIKDSRNMLHATRYIMNKNEFEKCERLNNIDEVKNCIDNFWIQIAGSKERAKEMIKNYYQRVIDANKLFTSYKYGWQTDRGMIYIIFGAPEDLQKNVDYEKWFYSVNGQKNTLVFNFKKNKSNPFTSSDFILDRSDYYKDMWYMVVDKIRQGRLSVERR